MKQIYKASSIVLNVFSAESPAGQSYELQIPHWAKSIAIDSNGEIHAYDDKIDKLQSDSSGWDTYGVWDLIAELEQDVNGFEKMKWNLEELDHTGMNTIRGVFEINI